MQIWLQKLLPQHALSKFVGYLANLTCVRFKNWAIACFIKYYNVDMTEAAQPDYKQYASFNDFFTRALKPGVRPIAEDPNAIVSVSPIVSPVDGVISELGDIRETQLLQAKGVDYELSDLIGGNRSYEHAFNSGHFFTAYLAPKDYHRVHMPISGHLLEMTYVPGSLFSVNPVSVRGVPGLFARNERIICLFGTHLGLMAMVLVGAMIVGSIQTVWHGVVTSSRNKKLQRWDYRDQKIVLERGQEMGRFLIGSTVILLFTLNEMQWLENLKADMEIKMGRAIGNIYV